MRSLGTVLAHAEAGLMRKPEQELRNGVILLGGQTIPAHGFSMVPGHAQSCLIRPPERNLCIRMVLLGSQAEPTRSFRMVLGHSDSRRMPSADLELRVSVALLCSLADCIEVVTRHQHESKKADHCDRCEGRRQKPGYVFS